MAIKIPFTDFELGFIVGLLEGEGSFRCNRGNNRTSTCMVISVNMTDLDVIKHIAKLLGVTSKIMSYNPNKYRKFKHKAKIMYQIELRGIKAIEIMKIILPYMSKRRQIKIKSLLKEFKSQTKYLVDGKYVYA